MRFTLITLLVCSMSGCGSARQPSEPSANNGDHKAPTVEEVAAQEVVIAETERLRGKITIDEKKPHRPVIAVSFTTTNVTDAELLHLKELTSLQTLGLSGTQVTDDGLLHLKGLTSLRMLSLVNTQVTGYGREELRKPLPNCRIYR